MEQAGGRAFLSRQGLARMVQGWVAGLDRGVIVRELIEAATPFTTASARTVSTEEFGLSAARRLRTTRARGS
jgi:hypothetical protein